MSHIKRLQEANKGIQAFYESWTNYFETVMNDNPDQMTLDDYAIPDEAPNPQPVSFEAIQKHLAEKARQGHSDAIRELIHSYGVKKLSEIKPEEYPQLWKQVSAID